MSTETKKPVVHIPFDAGTRTTATIPLQDPATGAALVDLNGAVVTLEILWPDHPSVARARSLWLACYTAQNRECFTDGPPGADGEPTRVLRADVTPDFVATMTDEAERSYLAYAVGLVKGWSYHTPCTPEAVEALLTRSPFVHALIMTASDEHERFLPPSLRRATTTPDAACAAPA
jgi:hypothetical protein